MAAERSSDGSSVARWLGLPIGLVLAVALQFLTREESNEGGKGIADVVRGIPLEFYDTGFDGGDSGLEETSLAALAANVALITAVIAVVWWLAVIISTRVPGRH